MFCTPRLGLRFKNTRNSHTNQNTGNNRRTDTADNIYLNLIIGQLTVKLKLTTEYAVSAVRKFDMLYVRKTAETTHAVSS